MHQVVIGNEPSPVLPDGSPYPFVLLGEDESVAVYADSLHDICHYIIGTGNGYLDLPDDDLDAQLVMRHDFAVVFAARMSIVDRGFYPSLDDLFDQGVNDEDLITFYMNCPDFETELSTGDILLPSEYGPSFSRLYFPGLDDGRPWDYSFPYIGLATDFFPHTDTLPPQGNVLLVDPTDERSLVYSLLAFNDACAERGLPPVLKLYEQG